MLMYGRSLVHHVRRSLASACMQKPLPDISSAAVGMRCSREAAAACCRHHLVLPGRHTSDNRFANTTMRAPTTVFASRPGRSAPPLARVFVVVTGP